MGCRDSDLSRYTPTIANLEKLLRRSIMRAIAAGGMSVCAATAGCSSPTSYMGISLKPAAGSPAIQDVAARARAGDKNAQMQLGIKFEEGIELPCDLDKAISLYRSASVDTGGTRMIYVPNPRRGSVSAVPTNTGPKIEGISEAQKRLDLALRRRGTGKELCRSEVRSPSKQSERPDMSQQGDVHAQSSASSSKFVGDFYALVKADASVTQNLITPKCEQDECPARYVAGIATLRVKKYVKWPTNLEKASVIAIPYEYRPPDIYSWFPNERDQWFYIYISGSVKTIIRSR